MNGLVSVIIPTYKGHEHINRAVGSVLEQSYDKLEIIVVDDNGKETEEQKETQEALSRYLVYENVSYICHKNNYNGSVARNTGLKSAKGEYVAFLDDDDVYHPNMIEHLIMTLTKESVNVGFVFCAYKSVFDDKSDEICRVDKADRLNDLLYSYMTGKIRICSSSAVIRRTAIDEIDGFDESFERHQDWEFFSRILDKYCAIYLDEVLMNKHVIRRNSPIDPNDFLRLRLHYLDKMNGIISKFTTDKANLIYSRHYYEIGKEYFKKGDLRKSLVWAKKCIHPVTAFCRYFIDGVIFMKNKYLTKEL